MFFVIVEGHRKFLCWVSSFFGSILFLGRILLLGQFFYWVSILLLGQYIRLLPYKFYYYVCMMLAISRLHDNLLFLGSFAISFASRHRLPLVNRKTWLA
jgi:hypothetical protein